MRLTRFTNYSLQTLIYLGQNDGHRVTIDQVSRAYDISKNHLMKVVSNLTRQGFLLARRGPGGGIQLNRSPAEISLKEVVSNTENYFHQYTASRSSSDDEQLAHTRLGHYLQQAMQAYFDTLGRFTLEDVLDAESEAAQLLELGQRAA